MNNLELDKLLRRHWSTRKCYAGTFASDTLPKFPRQTKPCFYICNTKPRSTGGEHWICFYFPPNGSNEYFDSYGMVIPKIFKSFIGENFVSNSKFLQSPITTTCGQYCLLYIYLKCDGNLSMKQIVNLLSSWGDNIREITVNDLVEKIYGIDVNVIDLEFLTEQIACKAYRDCS